MDGREPTGVGLSGLILIALTIVLIGVSLIGGML